MYHNLGASIFPRNFSKKNKLVIKCNRHWNYEQCFEKNHNMYIYLVIFIIHDTSI